MNIRPTRRTCGTAAWIVKHAALALLLISSSAHAVDAELGRWWGDFGLGYGNLNTSAGAGATGGGGVWLDAQLGARINDRWLAGLDVGGLGVHASQSNYDPNNSYSSIYGETITNVFLVVQYEPNSDHGWFLGAGAGEVLYGNKTLEDQFGGSRSGSGHGGLARVGYDWATAGRVHLEAALSCELGTVGAYAPVGGNFNYSIVAVSFHVAYH
jgi:hypothetical protein